MTHAPVEKKVTHVISHSLETVKSRDLPLPYPGFTYASPAPAPVPAPGFTHPQWVWLREGLKIRMEHSENHEDDPEGDSGYRHFLSRMSDLLTQAIRNEFCTFPDHVCTSMDFIIYNKMKENNILVRKNDPNYLRYFHVRAIGTFECDDCGENWTCYNVSIIVDFYKPKVSQIYKHYYRCCYECWGDINFKNKQFERIADRAIMYYKKRQEASFLQLKTMGLIVLKLLRLMKKVNVRGAVSLMNLVGFT